ncbi:uncharacterized protein [Ptychodera flava]|uniref:uncharacterized protein n=1 Tax=Ptychodera flava TaxID=63121 RepID=UPI003969EABA
MTKNMMSALLVLSLSSVPLCLGTDMIRSTCSAIRSVTGIVNKAASWYLDFENKHAMLDRDDTFEFRKLARGLSIRTPDALSSNGWDSVRDFVYAVKNNPQLAVSMVTLNVVYFFDVQCMMYDVSTTVARSSMLSHRLRRLQEEWMDKKRVYRDLTNRLLSDNLFHFDIIDTSLLDRVLGMIGDVQALISDTSYERNHVRLIQREAEEKATISAHLGIGLGIGLGALTVATAGAILPAIGSVVGSMAGGLGINMFYTQTAQTAHQAGNYLYDIQTSAQGLLWEMHEVKEHLYAIKEQQERQRRRYEEAIRRRMEAYQREQIYLHTTSLAVICLFLFIRFNTKPTLFSTLCFLTYVLSSFAIRFLYPAQPTWTSNAIVGLLILIACD